MVEVSPHLSLAFALHSSPGTYALLLGAGVSLPAGVPGAWQVLHWLIGDVAVASGQERPDDPETWWSHTFGTSPTYDGVLGALTKSTEERRHLLAQFFVPTPEEQEEGKKQPTSAHHAIARLVNLRAVRLILTTNFDLLTETAMRQVGIEPVVVSTPDAIAGMAPLHTQEHAVVHLHGDFTSPGVLNTQDELGSYDPVVDAMLDQVFAEYGLIVVGWSAEWDVALRRALERAKVRRFPTYWVDPGQPKEHARRLIFTRDAAVATATANEFLGQVADSVESLMAVTRQNPLDISTTVATAKRQLAGGHVAIDLHDRLRTEIERVAASDPVATSDFRATSPEEHGQRLSRLEADSEMLLALVATAAYWGNNSTDDWWFDDIARFAVRPMVGGSSSLIRLVQLPATAMLYAAGIAAVAARRFHLLVRLLTELTTTINDGDRVPIASHLPPRYVWGVSRSHRRLHYLLQPTFEAHLGLGQVAYRDSSERFEYLRLTQATFETQRSNHRRRHDLERNVGQLQVKINELNRQLGTPAQDAGEILNRSKNEKVWKAQLADAREELTQVEDQLSHVKETLREGAGAVLGVPHIRTQDHRDGYTSAPAQTFEGEIAREGANHPLLRSGFCGGDVVQARWSMIAVNVAFDAFAKDAAWSALPPEGGILISGAFYPDEIGKWANVAGG